MAIDLKRLVGRYQLVVSEALREFVERALVLPAPEQERERIRAEALAEAHGAELTIDELGYVTSRSGPKTFFRLPLRVSGAECEAELVKPGGIRVSLRWSQPSPMALVARLTASQPGKPESVFVRKG